MKINVSGLSITFYLFCAAVIISEYNYVGPTSTKGYFKKNGSSVELHNRTKPVVNKKVNWQSRQPASAPTTSHAPISVNPYSGNLGLNNNNN